MATITNSTKVKTRTKKTTRVPRAVDSLDTSKTTKLANVYPDELFEVRGGIPQMSDEERDVKIAAINAQTNSIKVSQANHKLDREIEVSAGLRIETQIQTAKNLVTSERLNTEEINLEIAQAQTNIQVEKLEGFNLKAEIERAKNGIIQAQLDSTNIDLVGEQSQLGYRQQLWDLKLENLALDVQAARSVLDRRIESLGQRINGGIN
jgi:hypothetical protein